MNDEQLHKTTDKGWAAMRSVLEQEMPEERKKKRFFWWWLLLLSPAAGACWLLWHSGDAAHIPTVAPPQPVETGTLPMAAQHPAVPLADTPKATVSTSVENGAPSLDAVPSSIPTVKTPVFEVKTRKLAATSTEALRPFDAPMLNSSPSQSTTLVTQQTPMENNTANIKLPVQPTWLSTTLSLIQPITRPLPKPLTIEAPVKPAATIKPTRHNAQWRVGAATFVSTEQFQRVNNLGVGLNIQWQFQKRWGLQTGLYYNHYFASAKTQPVVSLTSTEYTKASDSNYILIDNFGNVQTPTVNADALQGGVILPVVSIKSLELPVMASWKCFKQWELLGGINTAYILATQTSKDAYSGQYTVNTVSESATRNVNTLVINGIQRWQFDLQTGVGVHLGKNLVLGLWGKFPLQSIPLARKNELDNFGGLGTISTATQRRLPSLSLYGTYYFGQP
jgi:Outer membrane protein beta-barrel domain